jgi:probable rRNA maturation factor
MKLHIENLSQRRAPRRFLQLWVKQVLRELVHERVRVPADFRHLRIVFVDPPQMKRLNRQFRQHDYATDVLSFAPSEDHFLGELVICPQVVRRQSQEHQLSFRDELGYLVIHGILHLLGYDHERNAREAKKMFALQDRLFEILCHGSEAGTNLRHV